MQEPAVEGLGDRQAGNLLWRSLISADRTPSAELILGVAEFPAHGRLNLHRHAPAEFYFGLAGEGTVTAGGATLRIVKGVAIFIPPDLEHGVIAGAGGLSMVYGFARNSFEEIEYFFSDVSGGCGGEAGKRYRASDAAPGLAANGKTAATDR